VVEVQVMLTLQLLVAQAVVAEKTLLILAHLVFQDKEMRVAMD
jgi:hypothetical protein